MLCGFILAFGLCMTNFVFSVQPIKAIIFDCDGTLVDSEESHLSAWRHALQNRGYELTPEQCLLYTGKPCSTIVRLIAKEIGCVDSANAMLVEKTTYYQKLHEKGLPPKEHNSNPFISRLFNSQMRICSRTYSIQ